uniref:Sleeping Beauty transposase HTH domain-containing protein n=1 Tax=Oncorhynchus tshawytscha TaxID=74940 RepID=A0AAZ3RTS9_ONCTS
MRSKELLVELQDRIVSRHRSGEEYQNISAALKVPKNTVAFIFLQWKTFVTTKTLPRAGRTVKLSNRGRRALVREVTNGHSDRAPEFLCGDGRTIRRKPLLRKRNMTARLEFAKRYLTRFSGLIKPRLHSLAGMRPGTIPTVKHGGDSIMLWAVFQWQGLGD